MLGISSAHIFRIAYISAVALGLMASIPLPAHAGMILSANDLTRLVDIGPVYPSPREHVFSPSPDGKHAAAQIRRADPVSNHYIISIVVINIAGKAVSRTIDEGGEFRLQYVNAIGGALVSTGYAAAVPLRWSADSKWVYFLKRNEGRTQIWRASGDGSSSGAVTNETADVGNFLIDVSGKSLLYSISREDATLKTDLDAEALIGHRYDGRFVPLFEDHPSASSVMKRSLRSIDLETRVSRDASAAEASAFDLRLDEFARVKASSGSGRVAFVRDAVASKDTRTGKLVASDIGGREQICMSEYCSGALLLWWSKDGSRVRYMRRDGWGDSEIAIYEWEPGTSNPERIYATSDLLIDCQPLVSELVCAREQSARPRHIVMLNPDSGKSKVIYDPNPNFSRFALGRVERLQWKNNLGIETFGDLVYPVDYVRGRKYPLIVVQYISRGFLRGGVGDEFPIQAFAARGYAVLSVQRPDPRSLAPASDGTNNLLTDFRDRRSVLSAIEIAVQNLIDRGLVDSGKVGITGLSDGSSTVQFALINSTMFKAASVSGCCWEPFQDALVGLGGAEAYHQRGWPRLVDYTSEFWSLISLVKNARKVRTPLLIQQSDDEFRGAVASYVALQQAGQPTAFFVFPDEHHVKWQPAHRLAAYERNLRWFDYWLRQIGDGREWRYGD